MSASTALAENAASYRRLRAFANALNVFATAAPPARAGASGAPGSDGRSARPAGSRSRLVYGALWLLLPWPAAIGYRRFLHGLLIRSGRTRLVALGTVFRLVGMTATALLLFSVTDCRGRGWERPRFPPACRGGAGDALDGVRSDEGAAERGPAARDASPPSGERSHRSGGRRARVSRPPKAKPCPSLAPPHEHIARPRRPQLP